jgi:V-type H+-transporting ATPase subunit a
MWTILREKSIFLTLNTFKKEVSGTLRGEGWVLKSMVPTFKNLVEREHAKMALGGACVVESLAKPWPTPPTYFECNDFMQAYQDFVDTYGVPRYKECNPALFTALALSLRGLRGQPLDQPTVTFLLLHLFSPLREINPRQKFEL